MKNRKDIALRPARPVNQHAKVPLIGAQKGL